MIKSIFIGSTMCVLLAISLISFSQTFTQAQNPSKTQSQSQVENAVVAADLTPKVESRERVVAESPVTAGKGSLNPTEEAQVKPVRAAETYVATAYSLRGRTASGRYVSRGLIAADPRVLPLGTRVRLEAGSMSGEYLVADTGGAVKGRHVDIWIPSTRDAMRFGRRPVKLTVLSYGPRKTRAAKASSEMRGKLSK